MELLLARCPEVPILKKLAARYGIEEPRFPKENDTCILCGLCVRTCERMGANAISLTGRGVDMKVDTPFHHSSRCLYSLWRLRHGVSHRTYYPGNHQGKCHQA